MLLIFIYNISFIIHNNSKNNLKIKTFIAADARNNYILPKIFYEIIIFIFNQLIVN